MNRVILIGRLTKDPEIRRTQSDKAVCSFTLAVDRRFPSASGEREADFIPVVVWGTQADNCAKYLVKGQQCAVCGEMRIRSYEAKDGSRRYVTEVVADEVQFLARAQGGNTGGYNDRDFTPLSDDEDLPF